MFERLASAFKEWVSDVKEALTKEPPEEKLSEEELQVALARAFQLTRDSYTGKITPALSRAFLEGMVDAGYGVDEGLVDTLAGNYAQQLVAYANRMTSQAAAEAYRGIINRRKPHKQAYGFMADSFGADRQAVRSLLKMFDREPDKDQTFKDRESKKKRAMDRYVAAAVNKRAKKMSEEEPFRARETAKALVWNLAEDQGLAPEGSKKMWVTARDELVCKVCGPMQGQRVGLREKFILPDKRQVWAPQLHINCRCKAVIVKEVENVLGDRPSRFSRVRKNWNESTTKRDKGGQFASVDTLGPRGRTAVMDRPKFSHDERTLLQSVMAQPEFQNRDREGRNKMLTEALQSHRLPQAAVDMEFDELKTRMAEQPKVTFVGSNMVTGPSSGPSSLKLNRPMSIQGTKPVSFSQVQFVRPAALDVAEPSFATFTLTEAVTYSLNEAKPSNAPAVDVVAEAVVQEAVDVEHLKTIVTQVAQENGVDIKPEELVTPVDVSQAASAAGVLFEVALDKPVYMVVDTRETGGGKALIRGGRIAAYENPEEIKRSIDEKYRDEGREVWNHIQRFPEDYNITKDTRNLIDYYYRDAAKELKDHLFGDGGATYEPRYATDTVSREEAGRGHLFYDENENWDGFYLDAQDATWLEREYGLEKDLSEIRVVEIGTVTSDESVAEYLYDAGDSMMRIYKDITIDLPDFNYGEMARVEVDWHPEVSEAEAKPNRVPDSEYEGESIDWGLDPLD